MQASEHASKKTDFTVDFLWWGSLRLAPNTVHAYIQRCMHACLMDILCGGSLTGKHREFN